MENKAIIKKDNIFHLMAVKYHLNEEDFKNTIKATLMPVDKNGRFPSDEDIMAFLIVAHQYNLNPFTGEISAFANRKGGITPVVGIDGHSAILNSQENFDGMDIIFSEEEVTLEGAKQCPKWCEIKIYKKNTSKPTVVREYLDEVYVAPRSGYPGPWQTHTKRMLRHKAIIQASRITFGITGIYDEDEAQRIKDSQIVETTLITAKPEVEIPKAIVEKDDIPLRQEPPKEVEKTNAYKQLIDNFAKAKNKIGEKLYYKILGGNGYTHSNEIRKIEEGIRILDEMKKAYEEQGK